MTLVRPQPPDLRIVMRARDDPEKKRKWWRDWYHKNKAKKISWQEKRRTELRKWLREYKKGLVCSRCPESHEACLTFHHRDPKTKEFEVSMAPAGNYSIERILKEIKKCDVLCFNCHAKLHWKRRRGVA